MGISNSNLIVKIIYLLKIERDGLILIDGKWGVGKTFFIKNILPRYYHLNAFYHISLLGVKSLADFKAKIINSYYLQDINTLKSGLDTISGIGSISSGSPASANVINSMITSISSSVRENILSKLTGIFILDDIERLDDNPLANEILNYCHSLYSSKANNKLDFIVVSNTSIESSLEILHKEKIISDSIHYAPSPIEILDMGIMEDKLQHIPAVDKKLFEELIIDNDIVNIRILMRVLNVAIPLYSHASHNPQLGWTIPSTTLLSSIFSFFVLSLLYKVPTQKLITDEYYLLQSLNESINAIEKKLWSELNNYRIPNEVKYYYNGQLSLNDIIEKVFFEPKPLSIIDIATSFRPELYKVDEKEFHTTLVGLISQKIQCELYYWLNAIRNYEYLTFHKYMPKSSKLTLPFMTSELIKFSDHDIVSFFETSNENQTTNSYSNFDNGKLLFEILSVRYNNIIHKENLQSIRRTIEDDGWNTFDVSLLTKLDPHGNYKVLEVLGAPFLTKCILKKWNVKDIEQFNAFLRSNYRISNISQFAENEKRHFIYLSQKLDIYCLSYKESFKFGAIYDLKNTIAYAISCL